MHSNAIRDPVAASFGKVTNPSSKSALAPTTLAPTNRAEKSGWAVDWPILDFGKQRKMAVGVDLNSWGLGPFYTRYLREHSGIDWWCMIGLKSSGEIGVNAGGTVLGSQVLQSNNVLLKLDLHCCKIGDSGAVVDLKKKEREEGGGGGKLGGRRK